LRLPSLPLPSFHIKHLCEAAGVTVFVSVPRGKECQSDFERERLPDHAGTQAENIHRVMFNALMPGIGVVTEAGPNPFDLIGRNRGTYTASAYQDATLRFALHDCCADGPGKIRVVDRCRAVGAEINYFVSGLSEFFG
jgi:hypothetical protein